MTLGLACARSGERPSLAGSTRVFRCDDGYQFVARFEPERVWLFLGQRTHSLPQIPSTSGIHYTDGRFTFRERDDQAWTEAPGESHARCVNQPAAVPWEEARLKGVDFRAVGQDSAWTLEIDEGSGITFEGRRHTLDIPAWPCRTHNRGHPIERRGPDDQDRTNVDRMHRSSDRGTTRRTRARDD